MSNACVLSVPDWASVRVYLPRDLDALAASTKAIERERGIKVAEHLLRMILLWVLPNGSLARTAKEGARLNLGNLSGPAFFKKVCKSEAFLESTFERLLKHGGKRIALWKDLHVIAVDATVVCGPAATGTDQRLHVAYDLSLGRARKVELTNAKGGETFRRFLDLGKGNLILADQGYGYGPGIVPLLNSGASVLVRFNFHSIRLFDSSGQKITPDHAESLIPQEGMSEFEVSLEGWHNPLRVFGARNPEGKAVWFLSDLAADKLHGSEVRELYMMRWQIELFFKRLKSILELDEMPTREGPSARAWLWAKLILATLAALVAPEPFPPYEEPDESPATVSEQPIRRKRGRPRKALGPQELQVKAA